ncbi:MAG: SBBP repeat-containing protein [Bryobacteraceae bacterium]
MFLTAGPLAASAPSPFSTFFQGIDSIQGVGHDAAGNIFVVGTVDNSPIPGHGADIVAARLDPNATTVAYFVYLGGSSTDQAMAMAVDAQGNAYITGNTSSNDFPVTSGFGGPVTRGTAAPFAVKLNPSGAVVYATLFAGAINATPMAIAVDGGGNVIISGTAGPGAAYPATPGAFSSAGANVLPFVTKLDPTGTKVVFSAVGVGGSQIVLGPQGDIFLAGSTTSASYPTTPEAFQTTFASFCLPAGFTCYQVGEQYVTHLSADGTQLIYSTYLTGSKGATNLALAVDSAGNAYVTGSTGSADYPYTAAAGAGDRAGLFLTKLDPTGSKVLWSVRQGGNTLALDAGGNPAAGGYSPFVEPTSVGFVLPPPTGNTPTACLPNGLAVYATVVSIAYVQLFSAQDGSTTATQLLSGATQATTSAIAVEPDGRILLAGGSYLPDVSLTPGVVFSEAPTEPPTVPGMFLGAFDLSQPAGGSQLSCVSDAATFAMAGAVAPGQLLTLYGYLLGPQTGVSGFPSGPSWFPNSLANVQVTFDGVPAPLLYVSSTQINLQVPFEVSQKASTVMTISIAPDSAGAYVPAATRMFVVAQSLPSLFVDPSVPPANCDPRLAGDIFVAAVALNSDGSLNGCANPAKPGSLVTVFLNGVAALVGGGSSYPATGSITGSNPPPFINQVAVNGGPVSLPFYGGTLSLAAGPLFAVPGAIVGFNQLAIELPTSTVSGLQEVSLAVVINGVRAAPFLAFDVSVETPVIVWMQQ